MASLSEWFTNFLSRSESGVRPKDLARGDLTSDRRKATLLANAYVEVYLDSEIQPKSANGQKASPSKLQELLSEVPFLSTVHDAASPSVESWKNQLSLHTQEAGVANDNLLVSSRSDQDHDQHDEEFDEFCSLEMLDALSELFQALVSSWPKCCSPSHQAMLRLIAARDKIKKIPKRGANEFEFDMIFSTHCQHWVESRFTVGEAVSAKTVRFKDQSEREPLSQISIDICDMIESSAACKSHILFRISSYALHSTKSLLGKDGFWSSEQRISLTSLISLTSTTRRGNVLIGAPLLPDSYKAALAVIIAYSLWHLSKGSWALGATNEGPWLHRNWSDQGVFFVATAKQEIDISRPYLPTIINPGDSDSTPAMKHMMHPSESILAFAILLINLQSPDCRQTFTDLRNEQVRKDGGETINTDCLAALDLVKTRIFKIHVNSLYKKAITACLKGDFLDLIGDPDEVESEIRKGFFQQVVSPLKRNLKDGWGYSPDDLEESPIKVPKELARKKGGTDPASLDIEPTPVVDPDSQKKDVKRPQDGLCLYADSDEETEIRTVDNDDAKYADNWFKLLEARVHPLIMAEEGQPRIKVAILDTGIQLPEEAEVLYEEQILCCKSWLKAEKGSDLLIGDRDLDGHGTHCASLLLKVAPNADIYVARVFQKRSERKGAVESTETQQAIADAITYAAEKWKVDIITMSFGCKQRVDVINDAIKFAHGKNILLFAAASNCGGNDEIAWPAKSDKVICVHATDGYGNSTRFTPNALDNADNFAVLGSAVKSYWPHSTKEGRYEMRMSGTSCAAPVAAGIAAIVIEFIRRKSAGNATFANDIAFDRLGERQVMINIFRKMVRGNKKVKEYDYVEPWKLFDITDDYDENYVLRKLRKVIRKTG